MKTAISVPNDTFERATKRALELGMSRSEFFSRAAARYLDDLEGDSVTSAINLALDVVGGSDDTAAEAVAASHRHTVELNDEW